MATNPKDPYYSRSEISNSDLTALYYHLYPQLNFVTEEAKQKAFHLGTLVDALITEPEKVNVFQLTVDDEQYTKEEFDWGKKMWRALMRHSKQDKFLKYVLDNSDSQKWFVNQKQQFEIGNFKFVLPCRCKFDWWLPNFKSGGDLKSVTASSYSQFLNCVDYFDWDRSRAFYMDIVHQLDPTQGNVDFIYAISKVNQKVFFKKIVRGDETYERGKKKYTELAFRMWMLKA